MRSRWQTGDLFAGEADAAGADGADAENGAAERRLPRTALSHQADGLSASHRQAHVLEDVVGAETDIDLPAVDKDSVVHEGSPSTTGWR